MDFISVRLASECDIKDIYEWRNDKITRQMSFDSNIVKWENHTKWFKNSLSSNKKILIICEDAYRNKISFVRFEINGSFALISINSNPKKRGKGFAKYCLINSINFFSNIFKEVDHLEAKKKEENLPSQKTFLRIGFIKYKIEDNIGYYVKKLDLKVN